MQHVPVGTEPVGCEKLRQVRRQPAHRHEAAPGDAAGKFGRIGAEQALAHLRVDAVGADDERAFCGFPAGEARRRSVFILRDIRAFHPEPDGVGSARADGVGQHAVQVVAVHEDVGRAVALDRSGAEIEPIPGLAGAPMAQLAP